MAPQGAYSQACAAYCNCAAFLRQHRRPSITIIIIISSSSSSRAAVVVVVPNSLLGALWTKYMFFKKKVFLPRPEATFQVNFNTNTHLFNLKCKTTTQMAVA